MCIWVNSYFIKLTTSSHIKVSEKQTYIQYIEYST